VREPCTPRSGGRRESPSPLERLADLADEAGATDVADDARALAQRAAEGRFYVACIGQFKRGKSTLLNALVGEAILPTGVPPVTSVVTVLRHGPERAARVRLRGGDWEAIDPASLGSYVSERENPDNARGVAAVEVFLPSPLLAPGMCLVDTPGVGSTFEANTAATRAFVPQLDAALVVLGADPPISSEELALVRDVESRVQTLLFVVNKADRLAEAERLEATRFMEDLLAKRLARPPAGRLLEVSAKEELDGLRGRRDWPALRARLDTLARDAGGVLVEGAEARGLETLAARLDRGLAERQDALVRPLDDSEQRIGRLKAAAAEAEQAMQELRYLLDGEQDRLFARLDTQCAAFLERARPAAGAELGAALEGPPASGRGAARARAFAAAQEVARRWLERWRVEEQPDAERAYAEVAERFAAHANAFVRRVPAEDGSRPSAVSGSLGFRVRSELHYTEMLTLTSRGPLRWLRERLRLGEAAHTALRREATEYLDRLVTTNASRVLYDLRHRIGESRRRLEAEVRAILRETHTLAERALAHARVLRAAGAGPIAKEVRYIEGLRERLAELQKAKGGDSTGASPSGR